MSIYLLVFCRLVIGIVFLLSALGKIRDVSGFQKAISDFEILPRYTIVPLSLLFIASEIAVVLFLTVGAPLLRLGFTLAAFLLLVFSIALVSVIFRNISASCNCFGSSNKLISQYDIIRNIVFAFCAIIGLNLPLDETSIIYAIGFLELFFISITAVIFVAIWVNLGEMVQVFR